MDLLQLFETRTRSEQRLSANEIVARAFENLLPSGFMMQIDILRSDAGGETSSAGFLVYRKRIGDSMHTVTESTSPPSVAGTRMLQVEPSQGGPTRTYTYVRAVSDEPLEVPFQLMDPFLCMWHERPQADDGRRMPDARNAFEILARRPDTIAGERAHLITVRPRIPLGYDRIELAIAESDNAILEYRYFADATAREPSLVAQAQRSNMRSIAGHVLPATLQYEDRAAQQTIAVTIRHSPFPADTSDALFAPRSFHRIRTALPSSSDRD